MNYTKSFRRRMCALALGLGLILCIAVPLHATTLTTRYEISYYDVFGGPSHGSGEVVLYDWALGPNLSVWYDGASLFQSFSSTFYDFPGRTNPITFGMSDIIGVWLQTGWDSSIWALGIYTCVYDPSTNVPCPNATSPYLVGTSSQFVLLVDPTKNNTSVDSDNSVYYGIDYTHIPEPSALVLSATGLSVLVLKKRRKQQCARW